MIGVFASTKLCRRGYKSGSTKLHTWPPIIPASHPTASSSPILLFLPNLTPSSWTLSVLTDHLSPKHWKDNSDIIPPMAPIPKQSRWTRKIDPCRRTTRGVAPGTRVPTDVYQSGPDYKPAIILTDLEQPVEAQKNRVPKGGQNRKQKKSLWWTIPFVCIDRK